LKHRFLNILSSIILFSFISINASADSAAFGLFINESGNESLNYLEKILPNSFASALKNKYDYDIIKPAQIPSITDVEDTGQKKEIVREEDLERLTDNIDADYFIYGSFKPLESNKIKLTVNIYRMGTPSVFQFEETGYLETEIFKLVDKIAAQIKNIANDSMIYKNAVISSKSKLAIITNVEGDDLNSLYYEFLNSGYKLSPIQGNEIYGMMDDQQILKFYHLSGINASYHFIHNRKDVELLHGTWSGNKYYKNILEEKKIYEQYSFDYLNTKKEILKKIKSFNADAIDYIIIIGFDDDKTTAWIRCLDLKDNKLIITESGITGSSVDEIAKSIIKSITSGLPGNI
jgi:hypothetical protein